MRDVSRWVAMSLVIGTIGAAASVLLTPRSSSAQIIPSDRRIEWSPGVRGGIPNYPVQHDVVESFGAVGDGEADDTEAIKNAIRDTDPGNAVLLPAGTYRLTSTVGINKGVVLRGEGTNRTNIVIDHARTGFTIRGDGVSASTTLAAAASKASNMLTVADTSEIEEGSFLRLQRGDDMAQIGRVTSVSGKQVALERPLYGAFASGSRVEVVQMVEGVGIEDMFILTRWPGHDDYVGANKVTMERAAGSWVKNIETNGYCGIEVLMNDCYECELRDSYLHQSLEGAMAKGSFYIYGAEVRSGSSDCLIENNIFDYYRHAMVIQYDNLGGNVFGYNMSWSVYTRNGDSTGRALMADLEVHHRQVEQLLLEGNHVEYIGLHDNTGYEQVFNTLLRNRVTQAGVTTGSQNNIIGNEFPPAKYEVQSTNWFPTNNIRRGEDLIVHGNYVAGDKETQWDPEIEDQEIPASYYLTERPGWFCDLDWPAFGGDLMPDNKRRSPAEVRYWSIRFPEQAPSDLMLTETEGGVELTWTNNSDPAREVDFVVVRSIESEPFQRISTTSETTFEDSDREPGTTYWYYVRARNYLGGESGEEPGGESPASNVVSTNSEQTVQLSASCGAAAPPPPEVRPEPEVPTLSTAGPQPGGRGSKAGGGCGCRTAPASSGVLWGYHGLGALAMALFFGRRLSVRRRRLEK